MARLEFGGGSKGEERGGVAAISYSPGLPVRHGRRWVSAFLGDVASGRRRGRAMWRMGAIVSATMRSGQARGYHENDRYAQHRQLDFFPCEGSV